MQLSRRCIEEKIDFRSFGKESKMPGKHALDFVGKNGKKRLDSFQDMKICWLNKPWFGWFLMSRFGL